MKQTQINPRVFEIPRSWRLTRQFLTMIMQGEIRFFAFDFYEMIVVLAYGLVNYHLLGPVHISRIKFNELSSCEVWLLNQFKTAELNSDRLSRSSLLAQRAGITAVDLL